MLERLLSERRVKLEPSVKFYYSDPADIVIGDGTSICGPTEINATGARIEIGEGCDIAAFVSIHCSDSHRRCVGLSEEIERLPIKIGKRVFIGQGAIVLGGCEIGDGCVIGAGVVLPKRTKLPAGYRVVALTPVVVSPGHSTSLARVIDGIL